MPMHRTRYWFGSVCIACLVSAPVPALADAALASNPAAIVPAASAAPGGAQPIATVNGGNLIGRDVTSARDQLVGEIESVYVDGKGNVRQVIVTGMREHPIAIDWKDIVVSEAGTKLAINAPRDQVMSMPAYRYAKPEQQGTVFTDDQPGSYQAP